MFTRIIIFTISRWRVSYIFPPEKKQQTIEKIFWEPILRNWDFFALVCYYIITPCVHIITKYFLNNDQELFDILIFLFSRVQTFSVLFSLIYFSTFWNVFGLFPRWFCLFVCLIFNCVVFFIFYEIFLILHRILNTFVSPKCPKEKSSPTRKVKKTKTKRIKKNNNNNPEWWNEN